jgi:hypothetical protein
MTLYLFVQDVIQACSDRNRILFRQLFSFVLTLNLFVRDDIKKLFWTLCSDPFIDLFEMICELVPHITITWLVRTEYITLIKNANKKSSSKYSQVRSCCEDFIIRNLMVQSKFHFDVRFMIYTFFKFQFVQHMTNVIEPMWVTSHATCLTRKQSWRDKLLISIERI